MKNSMDIKWVAVGLAFVGLAAGFWKFKDRSAVVPEPIARSGASPLFEAHDKPMTIFLKAVEAESGRPYNITATIRQSKSRYNQMKQAVLAFLQGPRTGKFQVPVPEGIALNEFYFTPLGTAAVDFSTAQVKPGSFGFYEETLFIKGVVEVLAKNFFEVKQVKVLVDGKDAPTLAGHYALGTADTTGPVTGLAAPLKNIR